MSQPLQIGSLFSGYGGLDRAVEAATGAEPAWFVEFDAAPSKILAHHWPDVPNYGVVPQQAEAAIAQLLPLVERIEVSA